MFAALMAAIKRLYVVPLIRAAALMRAFHSALKVRFFYDGHGMQPQAFVTACRPRFILDRLPRVIPGSFTNLLVSCVTSDASLRAYLYAPSICLRVFLVYHQLALAQLNRVYAPLFLQKVTTIEWRLELYRLGDSNSSFVPLCVFSFGIVVTPNHKT